MKDKVGYALSLPGWLFKSSGDIASKFDDVEEEKYWKLTKYVKNFRGFVFDGDESKSKIDPQEIKNLIHELQYGEGFEEYVSVRKEGTNVNVFVKETKDQIKGMVFLVNEENTTVIARLKLKLPFSVFQELDYKLLSEITQ